MIRLGEPVGRGSTRSVAEGATTRPLKGGNGVKTAFVYLIVINLAFAITGGILVRMALHEVDRLETAIRALERRVTRNISLGAPYCRNYILHPEGNDDRPRGYSKC